MHKKFGILCASIGLCCLIPFSALALSESEYRDLLKDSEFSAADRELKQAWDYAKDNLAPDEFNKLKESQREWVKSGRDEAAEELMDFQGYSKVMAYTAVTNERIKAIREMSGQAATTSAIQTGIVKADKDYITVIAEGAAENKQLALESAYIDAVRFAVGAIISAKTELNNDELSENIIMHSRGVIEGFDVLDEKEEGGLTRVYIQARVHREILQDETKRYIEAQTVKADTKVAVKAQMDEHAKEVTTQAKQKSGAELLREVLEKYGPEDFFSASLNPKIFYDKTTKKPYVQVTEKFNQSVFWDKFLPELRKALDGVAVKKTKQFYDDKVRKANQKLNKQGYFEWQNSLAPYGVYDDSLREGRYKFIVPDNVASYMVYEMPIDMGLGELIAWVASKEPLAKKGLTPEEHLPIGYRIGIVLFNFIDKMCKPLVYSITYLDKDGDVISVQVNKADRFCCTLYPSIPVIGELINMWMSFAPGYRFHSETEGKNFVALGTGNYNKVHPEEGYTVELDSDDLQRLDSMKFEVIFD